MPTFFWPAAASQMPFPSRLVCSFVLGIQAGYRQGSSCGTTECSLQSSTRTSQSSAAGHPQPCTAATCQYAAFTTSQCKCLSMYSFVCLFIQAMHLCMHASFVFDRVNFCLSVSLFDHQCIHEFIHSFICSSIKDAFFSDTNMTIRLIMQPAMQMRQ